MLQFPFCFALLLFFVRTSIYSTLIARTLTVNEERREWTWSYLEQGVCVMTSRKCSFNRRNEKEDRKIARGAFPEVRGDVDAKSIHPFVFGMRPRDRLTQHNQSRKRQDLASTTGLCADRASKLKPVDPERALYHSLIGLSILLSGVI